MNVLHKSGALAAGAACAGALVPAPASADQTAPSWNCRASALHLSGSPGRLEPFLANGVNDGTDRPACADDTSSAIDFASEQTPIKVRVQAPRAATRLEPDFGAARDQAAYSGAFIASAKVDIGGGLVVEADALNAQASAVCEAGAPKLTASSFVTRIVINGQEVPVNGIITQVATAINGSPLSALVRITPNAETRTGTSLVRQALKIELLNSSGTPQATAVLGEAKVTHNGDVCAPPPPPPPPGDGGDGGGGGSGTGTGGSGTNTNTNTNTGGGSTSTGTPTTSGTPITGSSGPSQTVLLNGRNGGCGRLRMYVARPRGKSYSGRFGKRVVVRGRIVSCSGKSIIGARIDVRHIVGGKRLVKTGLRSRGRGRLTLILPMNMTTRKVQFLYRGNLNSSKVSSRQTLSFTIRNRFGKILTGRGPGSGKARW